MDIQYNFKLKDLNVLYINLDRHLHRLYPYLNIP